MDFATRRKNTLAEMDRLDLNAFVLTSEPNVFYLSGLRTSRPPGLILAREHAPILLVSSRERQVAPVMEMVDIENVISWERSSGSTQALIAATLADLGLSEGRIGFEDAYLTLNQFNALRDVLPDAELVQASDITTRLRLIKSEEELDYIRQAGAVSAAAMEAAVQALHQGKRECDAAAAAEATWRSHGMGSAYEPLIGAGPRSAMLRRFPGQTKPRHGEIVRLDFAAKYAFASGYAYHTDITRCIVMGEPTERQRSQLDLTLAVHRRALEGMQPGRKISDISRDALALAEGTEFEGLCSMGGHSIGLEVHEGVGFNETVDTELQAGMAFAVEPSIVIPGGEGTCVEDTVLVTDTGIERVTTLAQQLW